ncbi:MAG: hypothetical protein HY243_02585 [Proteobacteria bacterium]|nr:hypothetical protein [Pseudomonadota bacterium]
MSTLGEILGRLHERCEVYQLLAEAGDITLIAKLDEVSRGDALGVALMSVRAFSETADDEAWVKLIGRIQDADSPAATCLNEMISWSLKH